MEHKLEAFRCLQRTQLLTCLPLILGSKENLLYLECNTCGFSADPTSAFVIIHWDIHLERSIIIFILVLVIVHATLNNLTIKCKYHQVAQDKAQTAVSFKRASKVFEDMINGGGKPNYLKMANCLPIEGGMPLFYKDELIGSIGISGVTSAQDGQIAAAGVAKLAAIAASHA